MPDVRRCSIYGCRSNTREHRDLSFFNFPSPDSPVYSKWLLLCKESVESIVKQRKPCICSKHFHKNDVAYRRLAKSALPALFLTAPPGFAEEESARLAKLQAEYSEKVRLTTLMNDTVLEWVRRAQHDSYTASICKKRRQLKMIGGRVRNLLGATLLVGADDYWLRKFRRSHMVMLEYEDPNKSRNKTLKLEHIIADIDPNARILSEDEIAVLLKDKAKMNLDKATQKPYADSLLVVDTHCNGNKHASKDSFQDYSDNSSDSLIRDSMSSGCQQMNSECSDVASECGDSIALKMTDDDDIDIDAANDTNSEFTIDSYQQAREHLKPLEDFALKQDNYKAIRLLLTLESIFKKRGCIPSANLLPT